MHCTCPSLVRSMQLAVQLTLCRALNKLKIFHYCMSSPLYCNSTFHSGCDLFTVHHVVSVNNSPRTCYWITRSIITLWLMNDYEAITKVVAGKWGKWTKPQTMIVSSSCSVVFCDLNSFPMWNSHNSSWFPTAW